MLEVDYSMLENGRGPRTRATLRVAPDGTISSLSARGTHELGSRVEETFKRDGNRVRWRSDEEAGERMSSGPAFYVPLADLAVTEGLLVSAALRHGGEIELLPGGTARVAKIGELTIAVGGHSRAVHGFEVRGLSLVPYYMWMNPDGTWFGFVTERTRIVPEGWENAVAPLIAKQREVSFASEEALVAKYAERVPAAGLAFTNARVLDVEHGVWLRDQTVVIAGETIRAVGHGAKIPVGARVIDLAGRAVLPGLIDMHVHLGAASAVLDIASGVTTVRDVGNLPDRVDDFKQRFDTGKAIGPHIVRYGFIEGRGEKASASAVTAMTPAEAKAAVEFFAQRGYEGIKIYNSVPPALVAPLVELAHAKGMKVTGHIPAFMLADEAVRAGFDGIEHINMLALQFLATKQTDTRDTLRFRLVAEKAATLDLTSAPVREFIELLRQHATVIDPTLGVFEEFIVGVPGTIRPDAERLVKRFPLQIQRLFLTEGLPEAKTHHATYVASFEKLLAFTKLLHDSGVPVVVGTDSLDGLSLHHELALYVRAGFSSATAIRLATLGAARALGVEKTIGSIAPGKRADLFVVDGDPLADIEQIGAVVSTMRSGVMYPSQPLYEARSVGPFRR